MYQAGYTHQVADVILIDLKISVVSGVKSSLVNNLILIDSTK